MVFHKANKNITDLKITELKYCKLLFPIVTFRGTWPHYISFKSKLYSLYFSGRYLRLISKLLINQLKKLIILCSQTYRVNFNLQSVLPIWTLWMIWLFYLQKVNIGGLNLFTSIMLILDIQQKFLPQCFRRTAQTVKMYRQVNIIIYIWYVLQLQPCNFVIVTNDLILFKYVS